MIVYMSGYLYSYLLSGKVPALDINNQILVESLDICDYLDEKYPEPKLYPADANAKKRHKELIEYFDNVIAAYYVVVRNPDDTPFPEYADKFIHMLQEYENELKGKIVIPIINIFI